MRRRRCVLEHLASVTPGQRLASDRSHQARGEAPLVLDLNPQPYTHVHPMPLCPVPCTPKT